MKLKHQIQKLFLVFLIILLSNAVFSQDKNSKIIELNKNVIYGNAGFGIWSNSVGDPIGDAFVFITFYYEKIIKQKIGYINSSSFVRIGIGKQFDIDHRLIHITAQYGFLSGAKSHHFEMAGGLRFFTTKYYPQDKYIPISFNAGWRFQKPDGHLIFRIGTGYPELMYFGFGLSF